MKKKIIFLIVMVLIVAVVVGAEVIQQRKPVKETPDYKIDQVDNIYEIERKSKTKSIKLREVAREIAKYKNNNSK